MVEFLLCIMSPFEAKRNWKVERSGHMVVSFLPTPFVKERLCPLIVEPSTGTSVFKACKALQGSRWAQEGPVFLGISKPHPSLCVPTKPCMGKLAEVWMFHLGPSH